MKPKPTQKRWSLIDRWFFNLNYIQYQYWFTSSKLLTYYSDWFQLKSFLNFYLTHFFDFLIQNVFIFSGKLRKWALWLKPFQNYFRFWTKRRRTKLLFPQYWYICFYFLYEYTISTSKNSWTFKCISFFFDKQFCFVGTLSLKMFDKIKNFKLESQKKLKNGTFSTSAKFNSLIIFYLLIDKTA